MQEDGRIATEEAKKNAMDIAKDLLYYGYGFKRFMSYPLTQSLGEDVCRDIWKKAKEKLEHL